MATTGLAPLQDVGTLAYNGVTWSSLYTSHISGSVVQDEARRTTKLMEYTLRVSGVVTLEAGESTIDPTMSNLRQLLSQHAGQLTFAGKGFGFFVINPVGGQFNKLPAPTVLTDAAWGPVPKLLDYKPLGASRSAFVEWECTVRIPEIKFSAGSRTLHTPGALGPSAAGDGPVLQFNWGYDLTYDDEGYSSYSFKGTLEIPLTRTVQDSRAVNQTVDDFRNRWLDIQTDLTNFRVVQRKFDYSRDKRSVEWVFACEELPPMGLPPGCTKATGTMSVRNSGFLGRGKGKMTLNFWQVSLRATYTVRGDAERRTAHWAFLALWWFRMHASINGKIQPLANPNPLPQPQPQQQQQNLNLLGGVNAALFGLPSAVNIYGQLFRSAKKQQPKKFRAVIPTDYGFDEGLYLDSKTVTFHASWLLTTTLGTILEATGVWKTLPGSTGGDVWAASVKDIMGAFSWRFNTLVANTDAIVDFGGGNPPDQKFLSDQ